MEQLKQKAIKLLQEFKGNNFAFGLDCISKTGKYAVDFGKKVSVVALSPNKDWSKPVRDAVTKSLEENGLEMAVPVIDGAKPNSPKEDVLRIAKEIGDQSPDVVVCVGGGSNIDAVKAAISFLILGDKFPEINDYFGMNMVSEMLKETSRKMLPLIAVQVTSGSAAHLTKYSNITDMQSKQKFLIIDKAVIPPSAIFDYRFSASQSSDLTMDGGLDGISHCLEVYMGIPDSQFEKVKAVSLTGIEMIVNNLKEAVKNPYNLDARESIGLGTDLGGYAIMIGGTNGAHLNSFSLTDILSHGRACALLNPYYVVFFSSKIENRLKAVGEIYKKAGYLTENISTLKGRKLGLAIAKGMINMSKDIGFPITLAQVPGFGDKHIARCLNAAKDPTLDSKLKNMPIQLTSETIDKYMGSILQAAKTGDMSLILEYK